RGHTYYQVVEGVRDFHKVRQRVVASLGRQSTIEGALRVLRANLRRVRGQRWRCPREIDPELCGRGLAARMGGLDRLIVDLSTRMEAREVARSRMKAQARTRRLAQRGAGVED